MEIKREHTLLIDGKKKITLSGIEGVDSINEKSAVLNIGGGVINIKGSGITIFKLNVEEGTMVLQTVNIDNISYHTKGGESLVKKIFK